MKVQFSVSRVVVAAAAIAIGGLAFSQDAIAASGTANAKLPILVLDRDVVVRTSKMGQDIHRQIMAYVDKMQADFGAQGQQLQTQMQALQQQPSSPDRDKKMQAVQAKEADFRQKVQARQSLIRGGQMVAEQRYMADLTSVVNAIMQERGAVAVLDKSAIFTSVDGLDITPDVIQRLDRKDASLPVPLVNPPAGSDIQMTH